MSQEKDTFYGSNTLSSHVQISIHTHTLTHTHIYIYIYMSLVIFHRCLINIIGQKVFIQ